MALASFLHVNWRSPCSPPGSSDLDAVLFARLEVRFYQARVLFSVSTVLRTDESIVFKGSGWTRTCDSLLRVPPNAMATLLIFLAVFSVS